MQKWSLMVNREPTLQQQLFDLSKSIVTVKQKRQRVAQIRELKKAINKS